MRRSKQKLQSKFVANVSKEITRVLGFMNSRVIVMCMAWFVIMLIVMLVGMGVWEASDEVGKPSDYVYMEFFTYSAHDDFQVFGKKLGVALKGRGEQWEVEVDPSCAKLKLGKRGGCGGSLSALSAVFRGANVTYVCDYKSKKVLLTVKDGESKTRK